MKQIKLCFKDFMKAALIRAARKVMLEHLQEVAHEPVYKGEC